MSNYNVICRLQSGHWLQRADVYLRRINIFKLCHGRRCRPCQIAVARLATLNCKWKGSLPCHVACALGLIADWPGPMKHRQFRPPKTKGGWLISTCFLASHCRRISLKCDCHYHQSPSVHESVDGLLQDPHDSHASPKTSAVAEKAPGVALHKLCKTRILDPTYGVFQRGRTP